MCVTHVYTDCYPNRTVEFHQTIVCPNAKDGISCAAPITNTHPPRTLEFNDDLPSKAYLDQGLKVPLTSKPSPHKSTTTSTYRYSPGDKKDRSPGREPRLRLVRKKSALVSASTPRRKHPKERIVIVDAPDSPEGSRTLSKYAPDSPATEEFYSKNLLVDDRSTPRRSPNGSLNPVRTVILEHHRDQRDHSKEIGRSLKELPIILAPEPPSRSPSREKALVDMRFRREEEEREIERQREYERKKVKDFELAHEAIRREQEREMKKVAEELEQERIRKEKDERRREVEYQKFLRDRELEQGRERDKEIERRDREEELLRERERERARSSDFKREEDSARERERRRKDDELRRANEHEQKRREDQHRREREREKALDDKEREERMRKAEKSERKAADDARRLAEQVKAFAKEDEEIRRRPSVPSRGKEVERGIDMRDDAARWKKEENDMYARLRERQARDDGYASGLGRGASFSVGGDGDREVLDRLKERQKGPEEGYMPKRRTTIGGGSGRRRGDERIIWDDGEGRRGGRW